MSSWATDTLTPVELRGGTYFKREDHYAPLGPHSINGMKLRQLVYLVENAGPVKGILTGASVLSPQVSMSALVAKRYGLPCHIVLGATTARSAVKHPNVAIAAAAGAEFHYTPVAYNPALQRAVKELGARASYAGWYRLHYGITTPPEATAEELFAFHELGARQVRNLPEQLRALVVPFGSGNSACSILLGLMLWPPAQLDTVRLIGVGPNKWDWLWSRLFKMRGPQVNATFGPHAIRVINEPTGVPYGVRQYEDAFGIVLHPTYEAKVWRYYRERTWISRAGARAVPDCFWVVGSEPQLG